jgi:hypothetical protein
VVALSFVMAFQLESREGSVPLWFLPLGWKTLSFLVFGVLAVFVLAGGAYTGFNSLRGDAAGDHVAMPFRLPTFFHRARRAPQSRRS